MCVTGGGGERGGGHIGYCNLGKPLKYTIAQ
jgi:hypothetical protein